MKTRNSNIILLSFLGIVALSVFTYQAYASTTTTTTKFTDQPFETSFGGFTCASGTVIPTGTLDVTVSGTIKETSTSSGVTQFTITAHGPFTFYGDNSVTYTGMATFKGSGTFVSSSTGQISITANLSTTGSDGSAFTTPLVGTFVETNGITRVSSVSSPNC